MGKKTNNPTAPAADELQDENLTPEADTPEAAAAPAKGKPSKAPKEIGVYRDPKTREVQDLVLPHKDPRTPKQMAENYFVEHEQYTLDEVIVCDDGTVFPGTQKGANAAANYCAANKTTQHTYSR